MEAKRALLLATEALANEQQCRAQAERDLVLATAVLADEQQCREAAKHASAGMLAADEQQCREVADYASVLVLAAVASADKPRQHKPTGPEMASTSVDAAVNCIRADQDVIVATLDAILAEVARDRSLHHGLSPTTQTPLPSPPPHPQSYLEAVLSMGGGLSTALPLHLRASDLPPLTTILNQPQMVQRRA